MRTVRAFLVAAALGALLGLCAASPAQAQKKQRIIELEALIVEGQIQRPQAVYIIKRAGLDFGAAAKRKSFIDKVKETISEEPF